MPVTHRLRINTPVVASQEIDGETILIHFDSGRYYCANATGSAVLGLVAAGATTAEITSAMIAHYQATDGDIPALVAAFLANAELEGLLVPTEQAPTPTPQARPLAGGAFAPPALERFDDLQDLLMLDPIHDVDAVGWPVPPPAGDASTLPG